MRLEIGPLCEIKCQLFPKEPRSLQHMIDAPDRSTPRFPAALAPAVGAAIRERLARLHLPVVYTSAACGADLMFVEAALDIGAEVNVVLPFDRQDFIRTSVAPGGDGWAARFDHALSRATRVARPESGALRRCTRPSKPSPATPATTDCSPKFSAGSFAGNDRSTGPKRSPAIGGTT